jgi:hypothetical protein
MMVVAATSCGTGGGGGSRTVSVPTSIPSGVTLPSVGGGTTASTTTPPITTTTTTTTTPSTTTLSLTATSSATATSTTGAGSSSGVSYWWFVVAAAVLAAVLAIIFGVMRRRRRSGQDWTRQVQQVGALGATVHDVVSATTTTLMQPLSPDRALVIDQRINDLDVELHRLEAAAPDEETTLRVSAAVAALGSLRSAVGLLVDAPPGDSLTRSAGVVDARLADFDAALRGVTTPLG